MTKKTCLESILLTLKVSFVLLDFFALLRIYPLLLPSKGEFKAGHCDLIGSWTSRNKNTVFGPGTF